MLKLFSFVLKNLGRNKIRTTLTSLAVIVLVAIYAIVSSVTAMVKRTVNAQGEQTKLIVSERWVMPSRLPVRYVPDITSQPAVTDWTVWHFYAGFLDESRRRDRMAIGIATRIENLQQMHDDLNEVDPAALEAMAKERDGALVGAGLMHNLNWRVGQRFTMLSNTHPGKNLEFHIVGELPPGRWSQNFFFRNDYYQEGTADKSTVNAVLLRVGDAESGQVLMSELQKLYENRQPPLKVETESAGAARFANRNQSILSIIDLVVAILLVDMVIILSNSISISVRERRAEMAVLKVLGFEPLHIMAMVIGEAMLVGGISGGVGTGGVYLLSALINENVISGGRIAAFFYLFPVGPETIFWGILMGAGIGLIGSAIPAWDARKVKVSDVFARIA